MSEAPAAWRAAALAPPPAHGPPPGRGVLKQGADDFVVAERLGFAADGGVAHVLLRVEKRDRDTLAVVRELARAAGVASRDVGFASLKDRVAVATQWFTVPAGRAAPDWSGLAGPGFRVLEAGAHSRKLRRGALAGNTFRVVLREVVADPERLRARLALVAGRGVPNYFGPQRFGRDGSNLDAVAQWLAGQPLPRGREPRAFLLSAARSLLFNALLARRVADGSWERLLPGEFVNLAGRLSWFAAEAIDATLDERLARHDLHGTGPLAGRGPRPGGAAGALEAAVQAEFGELAVRLDAEGLEAARRPLRIVPQDFRTRSEPGSLTLEFGLPPGAYATAVLRELLLTDALPTETGDA